MQGLTQNYITPFALVMKATTAQIGLLSTVPNLLMSAAQLVAPTLSERLGSRRGLVMLMALFHALMWIPILLIPFIFSTNQVMWLITFMTISTMFDATSQPAWGSMMADLVPEEVRGKYFGNRNRIAGLVAGAFSYVAAGILQVLTGNPRLAFSIIFIGAITARLCSLYFLSRMEEPTFKNIARKTQANIWQIGKTLPATNIGKFIIFCALFNFSVMLSGPFFSPYMLKELKFNYVIYSIINSAAGLATIAFLSWWGKRTDKAGNIKILRITAFMVPFVPIAWVISTNFGWLIFAQIYSGFAWAGFQLPSSLFIYDASPQENRT
ncbi:MAG: MFS transporter, partial [Dehalococcoidales bacterium]|nr:MFS transporter [Dehalococcoidales bacterium]